MKRCLVVSVLTLSLALAASAPAAAQEPVLNADPAFEQAKRGNPVFKISFVSFRNNNGKPVGVDNFDVRNLRVTCDQGPGLLDFTLKVPGEAFFPVEQRRFNAQGSDASSTVGVRGRFVTKRKVRGKVTAQGSFNTDADPEPDFTNCFGEKRYVAR